jgi:hypothetical protein
MKKVKTDRKEETFRYVNAEAEAEAEESFSSDQQPRSAYPFFTKSTGRMIYVETDNCNMATTTTSGPQARASSSSTVGQQQALLPRVSSSSAVVDDQYEWPVRVYRKTENDG